MEARRLGKLSQCVEVKRKLEVGMLRLEKFLQRIWKATLASNLNKRDKAEILRLLIFAFTVIVIIALFVLNRF